ncbi:hypothetical protein E6Q11_05105 [Candidatus Dojkabacteria bacterium]|uniref:Uncharacterized protein n=1 Tax=Candidatus Dojkabacteria bacterium TaxID=2099670 RepID=A0A5C7J3X5_9BACT|nr:MAG: hypothetical protein E6Q11_05105 [Candidatus Dojkabacteria bacterium]
MLTDTHFNLLNEGLRPPIPYLNQGGCGWFALYTHFALKKLGVQSTIHFAGVEGASLDLNKAVINRDLDTIHWNFSHVVIRVDGLYYDSNGVFTNGDLGLVICEEPLPLRDFAMTFRMEYFYHDYYSYSNNGDLRYYIEHRLGLR